MFTTMSNSFIFGLDGQKLISKTIFLKSESQFRIIVLNKIYNIHAFVFLKYAYLEAFTFLKYRVILGSPIINGLVFHRLNYILTISLTILLIICFRYNFLLCILKFN